MPYPRLPFLALPLTRSEIPGWGRLFRALRIQVPPGDRLWSDAPKRTIRGKAHGYLMELDLRDWAERYTFFLGRYYELPQQILVSALVRPGDRVLDAGGNIGMFTLLAAKAVGPTGTVDTFEPNPACLERLRPVLALNGIDWVRVHPFGLSDAPATLELAVLNDHSGVGSFTAVDPENEAAVTERVRAEVRVGDEMISDGPIRLVKIDVEGFETRAVRGMAKTLRTERPFVVMEMIDGLLRKAGSSSAELFSEMTALGYRAYAMGLRRKGLGQTLRLRPIATPEGQGGDNDVLWVHRNESGDALRAFL